VREREERVKIGRWERGGGIDRGRWERERIYVSSLLTNQMPPFTSPQIMCFFANAVSRLILRLYVLIPVAHLNTICHG
jgi:hypothetical protein